MSSILKTSGLLFISMWLQLIPCRAQAPLEEALLEVNRGTALPDELLTTRSAVFIKAPPVDDPEHPWHWKRLGHQLHQMLAEAKVDAVAYYRWHDLNAGVDATRSYLETLGNREVKQVLLLERDPSGFRLTVIPTGDGPAFLDTSATAWHTASETLEGTLGNFSAAVRSSGMEASNFLINPVPEFFVDTRIFRKNRFESFQPDLKLDKLAVPLFADGDPEKILNQQDLQLQNIMTQYPFNYELVNYSKGEEILKKAQFQYVLLYLHTEESTLRELLDYQQPATQPSQLVYKFYIKHLNSGDVYLGDSWDGHPSWQTALTQHIANLKKSLKVGQ